jgi:hypothetical protein
MATSLNNALAARDSGYQTIGVLRRSFVVGDFPTGALTKTVGALPAGAQVIGGGIVILTAEATDTLDVGWLDFDGTTADPNGYASALALTPAAGLIEFDELAAATAALRSVATQVTVTASAALTTAVFDVIVLFVTKNPTSGAAA